MPERFELQFLHEDGSWWSEATCLAGRFERLADGPVVFYAMTCSSGEDAPRGIDFLFDSHRLNVAISRAQCLAVLVHCPRLLDADCPTLETMEQVDNVYGFVEMAEAVEAPSLSGPARV